MDAVVARFFGDKDYLSNQIQPPVSEYANNQGPLGGGWKGVLSWCQQVGVESGELSESLVLANCDCLIIHIDADIASEAELQAHNLSSPCPPAKSTCDKIRRFIVSLLGGTLPSKIVLCVPSQCTEAWVLCALHPASLASYQPIECRPDVERLLIGKPDRLVVNKDGRARKQTERYRATVQKISLRWSNTIDACPEARRFDTELTSALPQSVEPGLP